MKRYLAALFATLAIVAMPAGAADAQGVSKNEIVVGSIQDLSGPIAGFGKQVRLGMMLRVDEINEQGGINGRKLQAARRGLGLRPEEGGARGAEARQPGQDLHHGRPHRHGAEQRGDAGAVREERRSTSSRSRRRARCTSRSTGSSTRSRRPTSTRCGRRCPSSSRTRARRRSASSTRTTSSASRCCAAARRR